MSGQATPQHSCVSHIEEVGKASGGKGSDESVRLELGFICKVIGDQQEKRASLWERFRVLSDNLGFALGLSIYRLLGVQQRW